MHHPNLVFLAGPNGSGKTTFYRRFLEPKKIKFVNADFIEMHCHLGPKKSQKEADVIRESILNDHESFCNESVLSFCNESVFSDPFG